MMELYHLRYETIDKGNGVAAITATNPKQAEDILVAQGMLNGFKNVYKVTKIVKIGDCYSGDPCILNEENTIYGSSTVR